MIQCTNELVSEFLWFQRYITDHDLTIQIEIENDKIIVYQDEEKFELSVEGAQQFRMNLSSPGQALAYARDVIKGRFELGEPQIAKDAYYSLWYASDVIKERFELGEPQIAKDAYYSLWYARYVIKGRFELGEPAISKDSEYFRQYQEFLQSL